MTTFFSSFKLYIYIFLSIKDRGWVSNEKYPPMLQGNVAAMPAASKAAHCKIVVRVITFLFMWNFLSAANDVINYNTNIICTNR